MFDTILTAGTGLDIVNVLICVGVSLLLGIVISIAYQKTEPACSRNFAIALVLLPAAACTVISTVNGNLGTGIAILGAFSLVRFRSMPGNAKEIVVVFIDMAIGLAAATGYLAFTVIFAVLMAALLLLFGMTGFVVGKEKEERMLKIDIPEDLNYETVFTDILKEYTLSSVLSEVRTTNLGSMYQLRYAVILKEGVSEKDLIDELRTRNGNLPIICGPQVRSKGKDEL